MATNDDAVVLGFDEVEYAHGRWIGETRQRVNDQGRRHDVHRYSGRGNAIHVPGALAEQAVAWYLNVYPPGATNLANLPDNGFTLLYRRQDSAEVRVKVHSSIRHPNLLINTEDEDDYVHVAVLVEDAECTILGWVFGWEGKADQYWRDDQAMRDPAYVVPQPFLHPIKEL